MLQAITYKHILLLGTTIMVGIIFFVFFIYTPTLHAAHTDSPSPGEYGIPFRGETLCDDLPEDRGTGSGSGGVTGIRGWPGGLFVPVKDFEAEAYLRSIANNTITLTDRIINIEKDTNLIERDAQIIRFYLKRLCEKEFIFDHTIQHAWARVIGELVERTYAFVVSGYNANPIFITSQYIYYTLVDLAVYRTYREEIVQSPIGSETKKELLKELDRRQYEYLFPTTPFSDDGLPDNLKGWAPDNLSATIAIYTPRNDPNGWGLWHTTFVRDEKNFAGTFNFSETEYERRRERALTLEREKLAWGRGFFSYENCDLAIWTDIREDRRNCRIVTPGSLIQDQVSLVFGTAIRQMEEADEFEEWVAANSIAVLNDVLNFNGLNSDRARRIYQEQNRRSGALIPPTPVSPIDASALINPGTLPPAGQRFPWEFGTVPDRELENIGTGGQFRNYIEGFLPPPIPEDPIIIGT